MKDRVCLVTGATSGIGKAIATEFAARGATLLIHGRDPDKTERTQRELVEQSGNEDIQCVLANTKLANFWISNLFAEQLAGTGVVSNSYCPGLIDTDLLTGNREFGEVYVARLWVTSEAFAADGS